MEDPCCLAPGGEKDTSVTLGDKTKALNRNTHQEPGCGETGILLPSALLVVVLGGGVLLPVLVGGVVRDRDSSGDKMIWRGGLCQGVGE